jgi:xanthine dehydrogenase accessory factor
MMALWEDGTRIGSLSLGCLDADILHHAQLALAQNKVISLQYGEGSPYFDLRLPCGGSVTLVLVPRPDKAILSALLAHRSQRVSASLDLNCKTGEIAVGAQEATQLSGDVLHIHFERQLRVLVFGAGPAPEAFAGLSQTVGFATTWYCSDKTQVQAQSCENYEVCLREGKAFPQDVDVDERTAIVLFYHDRAQELEILAHALTTSAVYIGALGSRRAHPQSDGAHRSNTRSGVFISFGDCPNRR